MIFLRSLCIALGIVFLSACASSPKTNYFQLTALQQGEAKSASNKTYVIDPIDIPEVLERQHIVSYAELNSSLVISSLHLWASDLSDMLSDVSVIALENYFPEANVFAFPSPHHIDADYRITIRVQELAGQLGANASLQAQWLVVDSNNEVLLSRTENFIRLSQGAGYAAYVDALNQLVGDLNISIAEGLSEL